MTMPSLWDFVPAAPQTALFSQLVAIGDALERKHTRERGSEYGVTVGEIVFEAEQHHGLKVGGVPMTNKTLEQRQTSWLPQIMRALGFVSTDRRRPSPLARHHRKPQSVWIRRQVAR